MKTITFRYNKYKPGMSLLLLFALFWLLGFACFMLLNQHLGITAATETGREQYLVLFLRGHAGMVLLIGVLPTLLWCAFAMIPTVRLWLVMTEAEGKLELYEDHGTLFFKGSTLQIDRNSVIESNDISFGCRGYSPLMPNLEEYHISAGDKTYRIIASFTEGFDGTTIA